MSPSARRPRAAKGADEHRQDCRKPRNRVPPIAHSAPARSRHVRTAAPSWRSRLPARRANARAELRHPPTPTRAPRGIDAARPAELGGLLSDSRTSATRKPRARHAARFGRGKLVHRLKAAGSRAALIAASPAQDGAADELQRHRDVWRRKFRRAGRRP